MIKQRQLHITDYLRGVKVLVLSSIFDPSFFEFRLHFLHLKCQTYEK